MIVVVYVEDIARQYASMKYRVFNWHLMNT